jgi:hypothetical protein
MLSYVGEIWSENITLQKWDIPPHIQTKSLDKREAGNV